MIKIYCRKKIKKEKNVYIYIVLTCVQVCVEARGKHGTLEVDSQAP